MRKPGLAGLAAVLVFAFATAVADAAAPEHEMGTDGPFPDNICGIAGTSTVTFNSIVTDLGNDARFERGSFRLVFTADATGKSITIRSAGPVLTQEVVDETAGTITITDTFVAGLPELVRITNGPVLTRDAGLVVNRVLVIEFDPVTEEFGEVLSDTWEFVAGPHPDLESRFELFCEVVEPYLLSSEQIARSRQ